MCGDGNITPFNGFPPAVKCKPRENRVGKNRGTECTAIASQLLVVLAMGSAVASWRERSNRAGVVTKEILSRSGHGPQAVLVCEQDPHVSAVFTTALLGHAPARSTRASAANHRESISACRRDDLGVANANVTSKATNHASPQHSCLRREEFTC
jgi:hypothetical protein